ncbi:MAG TPA: hypothetical protein VF450_24760 [Noviherbaspirillum sp.]
MTNFYPFANETDSMGVGDLTIENRVDRISIYGSAQITKDKAGLDLAKALKELIDRTVDALERQELPEKISEAPNDNVDNPFKDN